MKAIQVVSWMLAVTISLSQAQASPSSHSALPPDTVSDLRSVLKTLWPALHYGETVGRIYFQTACQPSDDLRRSFPKLDVHRPSKGKAGVEAIREMFRTERNAAVTEPQPGVVSIKIGAVPDAILKTRIPHLSLNPEEQYNIWLAIEAIQDSPEVRSMMRRLAIGIPATPMNIQIREPIAGQPHLPESIDNATFDQALNIVARAFRGVVIYRFCTAPAQFEIDFADARGIYADTLQ